MSKIKLICTVCGDTYFKVKSKATNSRYCSRKCFDEKTYLTKLSHEEIQVILSGVFGDGCLYKSSTYHLYKTSGKHKEYIKYKRSFFKNLRTGATGQYLNNGFKKSKGYQFSTQSHPVITQIFTNSLEENLKKLSSLGVALWFFDDGALHHKKHFYNLNTHKFTKEEHVNALIPFFAEFWGAAPKLAQDRKKDGRHFYYLRFNKTYPSKTISDLLSMYPPSKSYYKYKVFSSETISKESRATARRSKQVGP